MLMTMHSGSTLILGILRPWRAILGLGLADVSGLLLASPPFV